MNFTVLFFSCILIFFCIMIYISKYIMKKMKEANNGKREKFLLIICLLFLCAGVCDFYNTLFINKNNEIQFSEEQIHLLSSIGINNTDIKEYISDTLLKLSYNKELGDKYPLVELDDKKEIIAVYTETMNNLYWSKEKGKVGMTISEAEEYIYNFIKYREKYYWGIGADTGYTTIDGFTGYKFNEKGISFSFIYSGDNDYWRNEKSKKEIRLYFYYSDKNDILFDTVVFRNYKESWKYKFTKTPTHSYLNSGDGIHEFIKTDLSEVVEGLNILVSGENPQIEFIGSRGTYIVDISPNEVENIRSYIDLYTALLVFK